MQQLLNFPDYEFKSVKPLETSLSTSSSDNPDNTETKEKRFTDILDCRTEDGKMFLYFKRLDTLYEVEQSSFFTGRILRNVSTGKYNLFNVLAGYLRFTLNHEADFVQHNSHNKKSHELQCQDGTYSGWDLYNPKHYELTDLTEVIDITPGVIHTSDEESSVDVANNQ